MSVFHSNADITRSTRDRLAVSGALATLVMLVTMFAMRPITDHETVVEAVANIILAIMPAGIFSFFLQVFGGWGKPLLLGSVMAGIIVIGSWIGRLETSPAQSLSIPRRLWRVAVVTVGVWVPMALLVLLASSTAGTMTLTIGQMTSRSGLLLIDAFVFSASHALIFPLLIRTLSTTPADAPPDNLSRRRLLARTGIGALTLAGVGYLGRTVLDTRAGAAGSDPGKISEPVTPIDEFYTISKNFFDPRLDMSGWELEIGGMVDRQIRLDYDELRTMPAVEQHATLTCISNEIGGELIDNAVWTGVRLSELLERAGVSGEPRRVAFFGHDGYSDSFEIEKAFEPTTIVAYLMNGEQLPGKHGYPARLIVPGKYGIKNGKWLRRIELVDDFRGYWQQRGWTNDGTIKTMSVIEKPASRAVLPREPLEVGGVAFAGDRGISRVELSADDGDTWHEAEIRNEVGPVSWTIWRATWEPPGSGTYQLVVRATDGAGEIQTDERADPVPDGASGYHRIEIGVA